MISNLNNSSAIKLINESKKGHLGCVLESGEPYVVPVNFIYHDENIYIHSVPGQKIAAMKSNPKICLQTEKIFDNGLKWQSVIVFGKYEEVVEKSSRVRILSEFSEEFPRLTPVEADLAVQQVVVFRLKIDRLIGVEETY